MRNLHHRLLAASLLATLAAAGAACSSRAPTTDDDDDNTIDVVDSGEGEGEGTASGEGEGEGTASGEGEGEGVVIPGGEGEGEGQTLQGEVYTTGTVETGTKCGVAVCGLGDPCCVGFSSGCASGQQGGVCGFSFPFACDGAEDCAIGEECCITGSVSSLNVASVCVAEGSCRAVDTQTNQPTGAEACVAQGDCLGTELCCSSAQLSGFGIDIGVCLDAAQNCSLGG